MDRERVVSSIVAPLFLFIAIRKGQRFRFLTLYFVFALLATRIKKLQLRAKKKERSFVYPRPQGCMV